jgi:hypothetical protein
MSEETETKESGMSAVKKAIIGAITTAVTAGGAWFATHLGGEEEPKPEVKTEQVAPAPVINLNLENNNTNQQKQSSGGTTTIIKEKTVEKATPTQEKPASKPAKDEEDPW